MTSKDISSMLDDFLASESKIMQIYSASSNTNNTNNQSAQLEDLKDELSQLAMENPSSIAHQKSPETIEDDLDSLISNESSKLHSLGQGRKGRNSMLRRNSENSSILPPPPNPQGRPPLVREVSFNSGPSGVIVLDECEPIRTEPSSRRSSVGIRSILKPPSSNTQPSVIPMGPEEYFLIEPLSDSSGNSSGSDASEYPSDQEDEDIEFPENHMAVPKSSGGFFSKIVKAAVFPRRPSLEPVARRSSIDPTQGQSKNGIFTYFGSNTKRGSFSNEPVPEEPKRPSIVSDEDNRPIAVISGRKVSISSGKSTSDDDQNLNIIQQRLVGKSSEEAFHGSTRRRSSSKEFVSLIGKHFEAKIYVETAAVYEVVVITSQMVAGDVIEKLLTKIEKSSSWALFELCNELGVERPIRDWEKVSDVLTAWDDTPSNALVMKRYIYKPTLSLKCLRSTYPRRQGFAYLELKPGKWQKRFCFLKGYSFFYLREKNDPSTEMEICNLSCYDIYTTLRLHIQAPTENCFVLRSDFHISSFSDRSEYTRFFCVDKPDQLLNWILALRLAKGERIKELLKLTDGTSSIAAAAPTITTTNPGPQMIKHRVDKGGAKEKKKRQKPLIDLSKS